MFAVIKRTLNVYPQSTHLAGLLGSISAPSFAGEDFIVDCLTRREPSQSLHTQQEGTVRQDRRAGELQESKNSSMMGNRSSAAAGSAAYSQASPVQGANFHSGGVLTYNDLYRGASS